MNNKPRIAFCFSWQARTLDQTYIFFQKNLFNAAKEQWFDYDVFCAVEDDEDADKVNLLNPTRVEKIKSSNVERIIKDRYFRDWQENVILDKHVFFTKTYTTQKQELYNYLQQIYKVSKSIELEQEYRKANDLMYTIVFRLRYDCPFLRKLNFINIAEDIKDWTIICNDSTYKAGLLDYRIINDFYFIWNSESFDSIWNIFYEFEKCIERSAIKSKLMKRLITSLENYITRFNHRIWIRVIPVQPVSFIGTFFFDKLTPEIMYYHYFLNKWLIVNRKKFSFFFFKGNLRLKETLFKVEECNNYEII